MGPVRVIACRSDIIAVAKARIPSPRRRLKEFFAVTAMVVFSMVSLLSGYIDGVVRKEALRLFGRGWKNGME